MPLAALHSPHSVPALYVGSRYALARVKGGIVVYQYGTHYMLATKGCLAELFIQGDCASALEEELEEACDKAHEDDHCDVIDRVLGQYDHVLDVCYDVTRCSSDGMLYRY